MMFRKVTAIVLVSLLALVLGACGQQETGSSDGGTTSGMASATPVASGMDHGAMPSMSPSASADPMSGMDHGNMGTETSNAPYDAQFIDSMIEHHTGAIMMAEDALKQSQRPEIKQLAQNIIDSQQKEVEQMTSWREQWYPGLAPTSGMGMDMGDMTVGGDPNQPYDQRFITAMIAHHNGAIAMAEDARTKAEHAEIKQLAEAIITAQEAEVAQLQQWEKDWFGAS
jgi:uncharacterized protein (DUF305 family)